MRSFVHPYSHARYEEVGDGIVRVTKDEKSGLFRADGRWIDGELTQADIHTLTWVGGPDVPQDAQVGRLGLRAQLVKREAERTHANQEA